MKNIQNLKKLFGFLLLLLFFFITACNSSTVIDKISIETLPDKLTYNEYEHLDTTGMKVVAVYKDKSTKEITMYSVDKDILTIHDSLVTVTYLNFVAVFYVTIIESTEKPVYEKIKYILSTDQAKATAIPAYYNDNIEYVNKIVNPANDGIINSREELIKYLEYNAFYHVSEFEINIQYPFSDIQKELDYVYWNSNYFAGSMGLDAEPISDTTFTTFKVSLNYYSLNKYNTNSVDLDIKHSYMVSLGATQPLSRRPSNYQFAYEKRTNKVDVYNSSQLEYALENGYGVNIIKSSPADNLMNRIEQILLEIIGEEMTEFQKLRQMYDWITRNASYDYTGDEFAGTVTDPEKNAEEYASQFASFYADGVILYGSGVCHGFARAYNLMMLVEGVETKRVLGKRDESVGRSVIILMGGENAYYSHGYNYVTINGKQYLSDITFAYAGTPVLNKQSVGIYRNAALLMSKQDHAKLYIKMTDPISSSSSYVNNSYDYISANNITNVPNYLTVNYDYTNLINEINNRFTNGIYSFAFVVDTYNTTTIRTQLSTALREYDVYVFASPYMNNKNVIICILY